MPIPTFICVLQAFGIVVGLCLLIGGYIKYIEIVCNWLDEPSEVSLLLVAVAPALVPLTYVIALKLCGQIE